MTVRNNNVVIEVGEEAAGVLVGTERGFIFHAVHPSLTHLHGARFGTVQAAQNAAREGLRQLAEAV